MGGVWMGGADGAISGEWVDAVHGFSPVRQKSIFATFNGDPARFGIVRFTVSSLVTHVLRRSLEPPPTAVQQLRVGSGCGSGGQLDR
jgi:hypothetical protein